MKKIAIFGSSFNPPHLGHLYLLQEVQKYFGFDKIKVIPVGVHPLLSQTPLPPGRLELVQKVFKNIPYVEVKDLEIKKKGTSWTIDTLKLLMKEHPTALFFIIIGLDQWAVFDQWKNFKSLLKKAHIVIINRTGHKWPKTTPPFIKELLVPVTPQAESAPRAESAPQAKQAPRAESNPQTFKLKKNHRSYGRDIYYLSLKPKDISSSQIRSLFKQGQAIKHLVPNEVNKWMKTTYQTSPKKEITLAKTTSKDMLAKSLAFNPTKDVVPNNLKYPLLVKKATQILKDQKGQKIKIFDLTKKDHYPFDWTVVVSGFNSRHTKAMAETLKKSLRKNLNLKVINMEGLESGEWIVLDYGDIVIHVFYDYTREYYRLEDLWST